MFKVSAEMRGKSLPRQDFLSHLVICNPLLAQCVDEPGLMSCLI